MKNFCISFAGYVLNGKFKDGRTEGQKGKRTEGRKGQKDFTTLHEN